MPQQLEGTMWSRQPLSRRSMAAVFSMPTRAFWWQWPWSQMSRGWALNCSGRMLPRATSRMMNSSKRRQLEAVFVAEGEDAAGFDADKGGVVGDEVAEFEDVFAGEFGSEVEASFGDGGTAAFDMVGDDDLISEGGEETGEGEAEFGFLEVGEFVGEEVYFARGLGGGFDCLDELAHGARREGGDGTFGGEGDDAFDDG